MLKSWRRRIAFIFLMLLALAGAAAVYVWIERASLAEKVIGRVLAARGIAPVSFSVGFIGFRSISLYDIVVGEPEDPDAEADSITIAYAPGELLSGSVRSIEVGELKLRAKVADGELSLGALDPLLAGEGGGGAFEVPPAQIENILGRLETSAGTFLLSGALDIRPEGEGLLASTDALEIAETVGPPRFAPIILSGVLKLDKGMMSFDAAAAIARPDASPVPILQAEGSYDTADKSGSAVAKGAVSFTEGGVTPATLSPMLERFYLDIEGRVSYRADIEVVSGRAEVAAEADLDRLSLRQTAAGSAVFSGPVRFSTVLGGADGSEASPLRVELDAVRVEDLARPNRFAPLTIEGPIEFLQPVLSARLIARSALPAIRGARLGELTAQYDIAAGKGNLRASGNLEFAPGRLELQTVLPLLRGSVTRMSGKMSYTAEATLSDRGVTSSARATVSNLGFVTTAATAEGVEGNVRLASLLPLRTQGVQTLRIKRLQAGVPLSDGAISFDFNREGLRLVDATWPFAKGKLILVSSGGAITASNAEFILTVQDIDLAALIELVEVPGLRATGHISGKVPVAIRNGDPILLDGKVAAQDDGIITYKSAATDAAPTEQTKLLTDALRNFHYTELSGGLSGNANGDLVLALALRGANPDLYDGYPFAINVKLEGSLAEVLRRGTVGFSPIELIKQEPEPALTPPAKKMEP
ncbi:hypothetical protein Plav_2169 [Parvibaculum lavamentivorans DS-1]|uniref:Uncharacterized protein n=1 Tax=Parvibaculum lavamentivorans (strain DS-1 / DSM 13023 / NCIMB 13966) TaxID=402881 RepID=A7HV50_PARL1|nr:YdbH domain-containing protein [Parvibaculum lavamentivorans]ABS63783.1 hypothetical protein Plav_2169 [Parvibaculum lavamentivorans DS-1]